MHEHNEHGGYMRISFFETYELNYKYTETVPREFIMATVDERVQIYKYDPSKIDLFIDEALKIHEKYQTQCNKLNKKLVKVDAVCDSLITIEHAHGGYVCGDDGTWSTECVASYCDDGYKFDRFNQECVPDACYKGEDDDGLPKWVYLVIIIAIIVAIILAIAIIAAIVIYFCKCRKSSSEYNKIEN